MKKFILAFYILYLPFQLKLLQVPFISTVNIFLILLALILMFSRNNTAVRTKFDMPLLVFLIIWIFSYLHTIFNPYGIWRYEITILFKRLIAIVLGYFVFSRCVSSKKELYFLMYVFLISIVLVGLYTLRGGMLAGPHYADFKRSSGPFGEGWSGADIAGGFLAIFTPFILSYLLLEKRIKFKLLGVVGLIICVIGILATYSRGSIMALGAGCIVTILMLIKKLFKTSRPSAAVIMLIFIALGIGWKYWVPESIMHRAEETVKEEDYYGTVSLDQSSQMRMDKWRGGIEIFKSNPLFGVGFKVPEFMLGTDTHNTFIQIAAEMGIIGITAFIWFLWSIFRESALLLKTEFSVIGAGFIGSLIAFVSVNMFYSNFFRDNVVGSFWIILGILAAFKRYVIQPKIKQKVL